MHDCGPLPSDMIHCTQYKKIDLKKFDVGINSKDQCMFLDDSIVVVRDILKTTSSDIVFVYQNFNQMSNFFHYLNKSELFNIYEVTNLDPGFYCAPLTQVQGKAFLMPYKNKFVVLPLVHCL